MKKIKIISILLMFCIISVPNKVFANANNYILEENDNTYTPQIETTPLTPKGNLTMIDDITVEDSESKQFITLQSKNGNYFYLVIDRTSDKENVYFLNLVDEADLLALIENPPKEQKSPPTELEIPQQPVEEVEEVEEPTTKKPNFTMLLILFLIIAFICGGIYYYFKKIKSKPNDTSTNFDDFEEDDDEYIFEDDENIQDGDNDNENNK